MPARALTEEALREGLATRTIGSRIVVLERTHSTNADAVRLAAEKAPTGTVVFAEQQTGGRGRLDRSWESPPGRNLALSVVLRSSQDPSKVPLIAIAAGVAVCEALIETTGVAARVKWPNDVLVGGRKISGILSEVTFDETGRAATIVGIGVNVNTRPEELSDEVRDIATSVAIETGREAAREPIARAILSRLESWYEVFEAEGRDRIVDRWSELSATLGRDVVVRPGGESIRGKAVAMDADGALVLESGGGRRRVTIGDVSDT